MNPIRKPTAAGATQVYEFDVAALQFLVKNMSGGDITVRFAEDDENADTWTIPDGAWQMLPVAETGIYHDKVYVTATATSATARGVEIEAAKYRLLRR